MTADEPAHGNDQRPAIVSIAVGLIVGAGLAGACWGATGAGLGLLIGAIALIALLAAPLTLWPERLRDRLLLAGGLVDGVGLIWLIAAIVAGTGLVEWLLCYLILLGFVTALAGMAVALERVGRSSIASAAIVTVMALMWLAWPIWLAGALRGAGGERLAAWLVPVHPILAINGVLHDAGPWPERHLAYQLMTLGQDVAYRLPSQPWAALVGHAALGGLLLLIGTRLRRRAMRLAVDVPDGAEGNGGQ